MRYYVLCPHCGKKITLRGRYATAEERRQALGDFPTLHCRHCGQEVRAAYTWLWAEGWGPMGTVAVLSAMLLLALGAAALIQNGEGREWVVLIPLAAIAAYAIVAKRVSDAIERFNQSQEEAPEPQLTPEAAATWSDIDLLDWFDICGPEDYGTPFEQTLYYATLLNHEEGPRYMEWFYFYEGNYNDQPDDGRLLQESLMAVGATRHAAIVQEAREIYQQHREEVDQCVKSVTQDGYHLLLGLNLFEQQDNALAEAYHTEPLVPLVAAYIRSELMAAATTHITS
jgi:hypothetical protein